MQTKLAFRRKLRREQTDAERTLWALLRSRQLESYKFRRQHSIGPYVADFCCLEKRLVVELDGGQHAEHMTQDKERDAFLKNKGFRVLRVWDNEMLKEKEAVGDRILAELESIPSASMIRVKAYGWKG